MQSEWGASPTFYWRLVSVFFFFNAGLHRFPFTRLANLNLKGHPFMTIIHATPPGFKLFVQEGYVTASGVLSISIHEIGYDACSPAVQQGVEDLLADFFPAVIYILIEKNPFEPGQLIAKLSCYHGIAGRSYEIIRTIREGL
jgi:hypothetical protein